MHELQKSVIKLNRAILTINYELMLGKI